MKYIIIAVLAIIMVFAVPSSSQARVYIFDESVDVKNDLNLHLYLFNSTDKTWQTEWQNTIKPGDYKDKEIPGFDPSAFEKGILVATQGQAVFYKAFEKQDNDIGVSFGINSVSFAVLDWLGFPIEKADVGISCFIPEMYDYIHLYNTKPDKNGEILLQNLNPAYQYKITVEGPDIYYKEIVFSSQEDFTEAPICGYDGNIIYENPVYIIEKNTLYGSFKFLNSSAKPKIMGSPELYYSENGQLNKTSVKGSVFNSRFIFSVPEKLVPERFCIACNHPQTGSELLFHDLFVSEDPIDLYFEEEMGICGRVANNDIDFPKKLKGKLHYAYDYTESNIGVDQATGGYITTDTDDSGNFFLPVQPYVHYPDYDVENIRDEKLYCDLFLSRDGTQLNHRHHFDEKDIQELRKGPVIFDLGDVYFEKGIKLSGNVVNLRGEPLSDTRVYISNPGLFMLYMARLTCQGPEDPGHYSYFLNLLKSTSVMSFVTDKDGGFHAGDSSCLVKDEYDIFLLHDSYVFTFYPKVELDKENKTFIISDGNMLNVNLITSREKENIEVYLIFNRCKKPLQLYYENGGILTYHSDRLIPLPYYIIRIYHEGRLEYEGNLSFEPDERNIEKTIDITL